MKKKLAVLLTAAVMIGAFAGCGSSQDEASGSGTSQSPEVSEGTSAEAGTEDSEGTDSIVTDDAGTAEEDSVIIVVEKSNGMTLKRLDGTVIKDFDDIFYAGFHDGMISILKAGEYGVMDMAGNIVVDPEYDKNVIFDEGYAVVVKDEKYGFVDMSGNLIIDLQYDEASNFSNGLAPVRNDGKYGFIDTSGNFVIEQVYEIIYPFLSYADGTEGITKVRLDGEWIYINQRGEQIDYGDVEPVDGESNGLGIPEFYDGLCIAEGPRSNEHGRYGYVDNAGNVVIETTYYDARNFRDGLAIVSTEKIYHEGYGMYGFIDTKGYTAGVQRKYRMFKTPTVPSMCSNFCLKINERREYHGSKNNQVYSPI